MWCKLDCVELWDKKKGDDVACWNSGASQKYYKNNKKVVTVYI